MFVLNKIIIALISPLGTALLLGVLALVAAALRRRKIAVSLGAVAIAWLYAWSTPLVSFHLRAAIEDKFPPQPVRETPKAQAIVVLGGALSAPSRRRSTFDLGAAADRVWHAYRLHAAGKAPLVILSGGSEPESALVSEADAMATWLVELGVPTEALILEVNSRTTAENAAFTAPILRERQIQRILLVTSALHMRRALAYFRSLGVEVIPAATDHEAPIPPPGLRAFLPDTDALDGSARAIKEVGGWLQSG